MHKELAILATAVSLRGNLCVTSLSTCLIITYSLVADKFYKLAIVSIYKGYLVCLYYSIVYSTV